MFGNSRTSLLTLRDRAEHIICTDCGEEAGCADIGEILYKQRDRECADNGSVQTIEKSVPADNGI